MDNKADFVQLIKDRTDILDLLTKDLKIIKSGSSYKALCPFHEEKTPSFTINVQKQNYVCYGCGKSGDIFSYIMEKYQLSFKEALEKLAKDCNIVLSKSIANGTFGSSKNTKYYNKVMNYITLLLKTLTALKLCGAYLSQWLQI